MGSVRWILIFCLTAAVVDEAVCQCSGSALSVSQASTTTATTIATTNPYTNNQDCAWSVSTSAGLQIFLVFEYAYLEWSYDFLYIYDGTSTAASQLYYSYTNRQQTAVFLSSSTNLYIRFTSDYSITYGGFSLKVVAVDRSSLPACGTLQTASSTEAQLSYVSSSVQSSGCMYTISASSSSNRIQYRVPAAQSDSVYIYDGVYGTQTAGDSSYISSGDHIIVYSNYQYVLNYKDVANTVTASLVTVTSQPETSICSNSGSTLTATSSLQYMTSPNYPSSYSNNLDCSVTLQASGSTWSVYLSIDDYAVDYLDYLYVYDGPSSSFNLLNNTSWTQGSIVNSTGRSLHLRFVSSGSGTLRGFKLSYMETTRVLPSCASGYTSFTASTTSVTLSSQNYPAAYDNNLEQFWLITKTTETDNLVIDITYMDIEEALNCVYDSLTLYDGACTDSPVLVVVCGTTAATYEDSTGIYVLVRFKTDGSIVKTGFTLNAYIGSFADEEEDSSSLPDWVIPVIILVVIIIIITVVSCVICFRNQRKKRHAKVHSIEKGSAPPILKKKLTTHQLLMKFKTQMEEQQKKKNLKRTSSKQRLAYQPEHPPPVTPGPDTVIMNRGQMSPHPPPQPQPSGGADPVYPPGIFGEDTSMPEPIAPVITPGGGIMPPPGFTPVGTDLNTVPPPFPYITPAEARAAREAQGMPQP